MAVLQEQKPQFDLTTYEGVLAAHKAVCKTNDRAKEIGQRIDEWGDNIHKRMDRTQVMQSSISMLDSHDLEDTIAEAVDQALQVMDAMDSTRHHLNLLSCPPKDTREFLLTALKVEGLVDFVTRNRPQVTLLLQKAVRQSYSCRIVERYTSKKLNECFQAIRNGGVGNDAFIAKDIMQCVADKVESVYSTQLSSVEKSSTLCRDLAGLLRRHGREKKCVSMYFDVRVRVLRSEFRHRLDEFLKSRNLDEMEWADVEVLVNEWIKCLQFLIRDLFGSERKLCEKIFRGFPEEIWMDGFGKVVSEIGMEKFFGFAEAVAVSKEEPKKLFNLLDMFQGIEKFEIDLLKVFQANTGSCRDVRLRFGQLQKVLACSSLHNLSAFTKQIEDDSGLPADGGLLKMTSYVVNFLKFLVGKYENTLEKVLVIEGRGIEVGDAVRDMLNSLEKSLETRSKAYSDASLCHLFLMNNYWYMFKRARDSELGALVGETWLKERRRWVTHNVLGYEKHRWGSVMAHLNREGLAGSNGSKAKELFKHRLKSFNSEFDAIYEVHRAWVVSDDELRKSALLRITQVLVPAYRSFVETFGHLLDSSANASKYMRYSPDQLEELLGHLFSDKSGFSNGARKPYSEPSEPRKSSSQHFALAY